MPKCIENIHDSVIKQYFATKRRHVIGIDRVFMIKTMKNVIKPMFTKINFYYSPTFGYAF
jgi:hypothetical protein